MMTRYAISYALCDFVQTNRHIIICDFGLWCQTNDILSVCSRIGSFLLNLPILGLLSFRHFNGNGFSVIPNCGVFLSVVVVISRRMIFTAVVIGQFVLLVCSLGINVSCSVLFITIIFIFTTVSLLCTSHPWCRTILYRRYFRATFCWSVILSVGLVCDRPINTFYFTDTGLDICL